MNTPYYVSTDDGLVPVGRYLDQKQAEVEIMKYELLKAANVFGPHYINSMPEDLQEKVYDVLGVNKYLKEKASTNRHDDRIDAMRYALERHKQTVFPDSFYTTEPIDKSEWKIVSPSMTYLKAAEKLCEGLNIGLQLGKEEKTGMRMHVGAIIKSTVRTVEQLWVVYKIEKAPANTFEDGYIWVAEAKESDRLRNLMMRCNTDEIQEQFNNPDHTRVRLIYHIKSDGSAWIPGVEFATVDDIANHDGKAKFQTFTEEIKMAGYSRDVFAGCNFHDGKLYFLPRGEANATYLGRITDMKVDYGFKDECATGEANFIIDHEGPKIKIGPEDNTPTNYDMIKEMVNNSPVQKYKPDGSTKEEDIWCGSISERYSVEERMLFIIFDGLNKSVKICRTGWDDRPYKMCMYRDKGLLVANIAFTTWQELETKAMYLMHQYLHISFVPGATGRLSEALRDAKRVVKMIGDTDTRQTPESAVAIEEVIFNDPATVIKWADGTKTVVKAHDEPFDKEKGLAMAICKKVLGNKHDYFNTFKRFLKDKKKS